MSNLLADIEGFKKKGSLRQVDTRVTTSTGNKYVEKKDSSGKTFLETEEDTGLGFCPDLTPDLGVGVATAGLLVGSQDVAHDLSELKRHKITHILNVAYSVSNPYPNDFEYLSVELYDDSQQDLLSVLPRCQEFIDGGRGAGTVLIHCNAGVSRSASVALAYVMEKERLPLDAALERLRATRPAAKPNQSFLQQLRTLEQSLGINEPPMKDSTFLVTEDTGGTRDLSVGVATASLLVGSQDVAYDLSELKRHKVTHILNVAYRYGVCNPFPDDFKYQSLEMYDDSHHDLLSVLPQCREFINSGRETGTVLIHCTHGVSRSTSVALAYVMEKERLPLDAALKRLRATRPAAKPNQSFLQQLRTLEQSLSSKDHVTELS